MRGSKKPSRVISAMHQRWLSGLALPLRFYTKMITVDFGTRCAIFRFRLDWFIA